MTKEQIVELAVKNNLVAEAIETRWIPLIDGAPKPIPYKNYLFTTEDGEVIKTAWDSRHYSKYLAYMEIPEDVLEKINSEISKLLDSLDANSAWYRLAIKDCLKIIDKYKEGVIGNEKTQSIL